MPTLRLLSYNVRSLRDDPDAVARVIRAATADVVCIQEAPRLLRWRSKCAALARRSGLVVVTGGRPAGGNLILSTLAVDVTARADRVLAREPKLHLRGTALAELSFRGARFALAATHLDLEASARLRHVHELDGLVAGFAADRPTIIAGDINDVPGSPVWQALSASRVDVFAAVAAGEGFTYSARKPRRRIDAVFTDRRIGSISATVLDGADVEAASDHRPLLVELELP